MLEAENCAQDCAVCLSATPRAHAKARSCAQGEPSWYQFSSQLDKFSIDRNQGCKRDDELKRSRVAQCWKTQSQTDRCAQKTAFLGPRFKIQRQVGKLVYCP